MTDGTFDPLSKLTPLRTNRKKAAKKLGLTPEVTTPGINENIGAKDLKNFRKVLAKYVGDVNQAQHTADEKVQELAAGETENIHEVMIAMDEAEKTFDMMMEFRNKLVDAYEKLVRSS